jgi:hypothetical protein
MEQTAWFPHHGESPIIDRTKDERVQHNSEFAVPASVATHIPDGFEWHQTGNEGFVFRRDERDEDVQCTSERRLRNPFKSSRIPKALPGPTGTREQSGTSYYSRPDKVQHQEPSSMSVGDLFPEPIKSKETIDLRNRTAKDMEDAMLSELKKSGGLESGFEGRMLYEAQMEWYGRAAERGLSSVADGYSLLSRVVAAGLKPTRGMYHGLLHILECQTVQGNVTMDDVRTAIRHMKASNVGMDSDTANRLLRICHASAQKGQTTIAEVEQLILQVSGR